MISPFTSFIYFVGLTTVYFTLKYFLAEKHGAKNKGLGIALTVVYLIVMVLLQFGTNMKNATEKCGGTPQTFAAFNYTVMPNLFIFGVLLMIMLFFPGWKAPFSNTLGYIIVKFAGAQETFVNMLKQSGNNKLLSMVYEDPSMMINEMTPENFDLFISRMAGKNGGTDELPVAIAEPVPTPSAPPMKGGKRRKQRGGANPSILAPDYKKYIPDLYNFVVLKDKISEYLWYILTGYLVIQNSNTYIMSISCKRSAGELEAKLANVLDNPKKKKKPQKWTLGF
tara:strand:- start:211 stop:1053 length:843 start_codon:yes stop_codon:yes gene_type:complete